MTTETVDKTFVVIEVPSTITTDRGIQFESALFTNPVNILGTKWVRTTVYHPQTDGLHDRFHRQLKAARAAHGDNTKWTQALPVVLVGIRTAGVPA